uniref:Protein kinase domain-containing protein n=1 Tax=Trichuris muris TaxID=70415 RepID=A0A5S6QE73_TRIMR
MSNRRNVLDLEIGSIFQNNWTVMQKLGQGGFGAVYKVQKVGREDKFYALKLERANIPNSVLKMDTNVLLKVRNKKHICRFVDCGRDENMNYLVMSLAGPNLEDLFEKAPNHKFSSSTSLQIAIQATEALKDVHDAGFLHRDVKPANFAMGRNSQSGVLKLLDFGLARQIVTNDGKLRPPRETLGFRGTERYASVNAHDDKELGRHDDLISLFYMIIEFKTGKLPWRNSDTFSVIGKRKKNAMETEWTSLSKRLQKIYTYMINLNYYKTPDYEWIMRQFALQAKDEGANLEDKFDWEVQQPTTSKTKEANVSEYPYERQYEAEKTVKYNPKKQDENKEEKDNED